MTRGPLFASIDRVTTLSVECPDALAGRLEHLVREGWVADPDQATVGVPRRLLDFRRPEPIENRILAAVEWGLRGGEREIGRRGAQ